MSAVVTQSPVLINTTFPDPGWASNLFAGPYPINGLLYSLARPQSAPELPIISVSADSGKTWSEVAITPFSGAAATFFRWYWNERDGNKITFAFLDGVSPSVQLQDLDLTTNPPTYSAIYGAAGGPAAIGTVTGVVLNRLSTGVVKIFYITANTLMYSVNTAGVWTTVDTVIIANPGDPFLFEVMAVCPDSAGRSHFVYEYAVAGTSHVTYNNLSTTNVLGMAYDLPFLFPARDGKRYIFRIYLGSDGKLYIPELTFNSGPDTPTGCGMWTGSGDLSAPTWSEAQIFDFNSLSNVFTTDFTFAADINGTQTFGVIVNDGNTGFDSWLYYFTLNGATWSAPRLYLDLTQTPPPLAEPMTGYFLEGLSFTISPSTQLGFAMIVPIDVLDPSGNELETPFYLLNPAVPVQINPGPGGYKPVALRPNQFDFCIHRENRLYCSIDVARLTCGNIPECFSVDEREWGAAS